MGYFVTLIYFNYDADLISCMQLVETMCLRLTSRSMCSQIIRQRLFIQYGQLLGSEGYLMSHSSWKNIRETKTKIFISYSNIQEFYKFE